MNQVVIRIIDTDNNVLGDLDLTNFTDFPLVITKGIVNLDNLKTRTGTYTKTFKVPNTKNNSKLLSNVDNINARKDYRDSLNRKPCVILVNGAETERGFVQVSKVMNGFELDSFELVFFGNNIDWVKQASELKLSDITFRNNSQTYDATSIDTANAADSDTYDHAYPYVSRGGNQLQSDTQVQDYTPVFYLRSLFERGLNAIGWNLSSSFLEGATIKRLVCDFSLKFLLDEDDINATVVRAQKTGANTVVSIGGEQRIKFNDESTGPNEDDNSHYDNTTYEYTVPQTGAYDFEINIGFENPTNSNLGTIVYVVANGDSETSIGSGTVLASQDFDFTDELSYSVPFQNVTLTAGDKVSIYVLNDSPSFQNFEIANTLSGNGAYDTTFFRVQRRSALEVGDSFTLNTVLPSDVYLLDVINDASRMFNLYYWSDEKSKTVYVEPRDTFFKASTEAINWSDKLDLNNKYEVDYVSSYKRNITFSYRDLNNDEWLKSWQDNNKRTYGEYTHTLPDRFGEGTTEIKLDLFSAGYAVKAAEATPLDGGVYNEIKAPTTMRIWGIDSDVAPDDRISDYNPKIYLFNNGTQTSAGGTSREISMFGSARTTIPYGIFESWNNTTSDINLSFTTGNTVQKGLFETYYSNMLKNIEEGGRLVAYFNLSNVDIENLDFRKLIYIEYPAQVKGYYLIESVIDFNPIVNGLTKVSLFKFENLGSVPIDSGQGGNNNSNIDDGNTTPTLEPIYVQDGSNLVEVWIENPVTGLLEPVYR